MIVYTAPEAKITDSLDMRVHRRSQPFQLLIRSVIFIFFGHGRTECGRFHRETADCIVPALLETEIAHWLEGGDRFPVEAVGRELEHHLYRRARVTTHFPEEGFAKAVVGKRFQLVGCHCSVKPGLCLVDGGQQFLGEMDVQFCREGETVTAAAAYVGGSGRRLVVITEL